MKPLRFTIGPFLVAVVCAAGCNQPTSSAVENDGARSDLTAVTVVSPRQETLVRSTTQPAIVHAYRAADVHAKVSGYLETLSKDIGDEVDEDTTLATLSVPEMSKQLERRRQVVTQRVADEARAAAGVALAKADVKAAEAALAEATSKLEGFEAKLAADESEFRRTSELVATRSVAEGLLDESRERRDSAKATLKAAESAVATAKANVAVGQAKLAAAEADVTAAAAETEVEKKSVEELEAMLEYATLKAPFTGVVTARHVDIGDLVRNAQTTDSPRSPLFRVEDLTRVRVRVAVPEADARWIDTDVRTVDEETGEVSVVTPGDAATFRFKALGGEPIDGTITRHTNRLDEATRSLEVEIVLDNVKRRLLPGMYGEATIALDTKANATVLPATAVRHDETGRSFVYVLDAGDKVKVVDVTTGLDDGALIEITSGLESDARVVDSIIGRLQEGQAVRVN